MLSLYFHIPFCEHKCLYCDFYSVENMSSMETFVASLEREIELRGREAGGRQEVGTIFFGGGTPSLLTRAHFDRLFTRIHEHFRVAADAEVTCESNPGTVELSKLTEFRAAGFNRVSFGVQSFFDDDLRFLTRIHTAEEAERAAESAYRAGFANVNLDLIFALPGQTPERWRENLRRAAALRPAHISAYALIVEENTPLAVMVKNKLVAPLPDEEDAAMYEITIETLAGAGYRQYEVSNFARPGYECRHNMAYWNHADYLSFGPSAHSFRKDSPVTGRRWWNVRSVQSYIDALARDEFPVSGGEEVTREKFFDEEVFLGLRSTGVDLGRLERLYGAGIVTGKEGLLQELERSGLLRRQKSVIALTAKGYAVCDEIARRLIG